MNREVNPTTAVQQRRLRLSWQHVVLGIILLLALFLRIWQIETLPVGLAHDEAYNGLDALTLLEGGTFPIFYEGWESHADFAHEDLPIRDTQLPLFFEGNFGREPVTIYLMAASIRLFGPTPFALRVVPAILGVLAVLGTYLAATTLLSSSTQPNESDAQLSESALFIIAPLLAAFTMAILYPAITFSRYGVRVMAFVPLETLTIYCFWRGVRASEGSSRTISGQSTFQPFSLGVFKPRWYIAAGLFLGLGFYTYAAARFLPVLFVVFFLYWYWRDRSVLARQWANLGVLILTAIMVVMPLFVFLFRHPYYLLIRSRIVANRGAGTYPGQPWLTWLYNIGRVGAGLIFKGDTNLRHNLPRRAFLDPIQAFLMIAGIAGIVWRRFRLREIFLLFWLVIMLMPGILSGDAPHFGRLIGAAAPLAILISIGAVWIAQLVFGRFGSRSDHSIVVIGLILMILFMLSATIATRDYFQNYAEKPELAEVFQLSDWQLGQYASTLPDEATVYLTPNQQKMATIYYALGGQRERLRSFHSPQDSLTPAGQPGKESIFLIRPSAEAVFDRLTNLFPGGVVDKSAPSFHAFWLTGEGEGLPYTNTSDITWGGAISLQEWTAEPSGDSLSVTLTWQAIVEMTRDYTVYVHILSQDGTLIAQTDRLPDGYPTSDWQANEVVMDTFQVTLPENLQAGPYRVQSGFYYLPTLERLGEPLVLGEIEIP